MYTKDFIEFVRNGVDSEYFIGIGNPNAKILLVGKESAIPVDDQYERTLYAYNAKEWLNHIANNTCQGLEYSVDEKHVLRRSWGKNTWSKYQKLSDYILNNESEYYVDFLKYAFTTEMNDSPSKRAVDADKSSLNKRKILFKDSGFIQNFPIVILACSNYIKNNDEIREIDDIFKVTYDGHDTGRYCYSKGNSFYIHHSADKNKLVIHTRQLSANVNNELLKDMGIIIREHLNSIEQ